MPKQPSFEHLFDQALTDFPYELNPTSIAQGTLDTDNNGDIEYAEEYIFAAGRLLDEELSAGGWIELRHDHNDTSISAFFGVARNADWKEGRILPEDMAIQGVYNLDSRMWELWIDQY
jgi:hypothetical protein